MSLFYAFALACFCYTALYLRHCVKTRQRSAAAGAVLLLIGAVCAAVLPFL